MKKVFMLMLMVLLASIIFIGCSSDEDASNGDTEGANNDETVTLTIWDYYGTTTPIKPLIPAFEEEFPNIKIDFQAQAWDNYWDQLAVGATSGNLPDLATTGLMWAPQYVEYGIYADLSEFTNGQVNGEEISDVFSEGMLNAASLDGALYGMPYDFDAYSLYYRADLLEEEGFSGPPGTWDELVEIGEKLTKDLNGDGRIDQYAYLIQPSWNSWEPFLYSNGGRVLNDDNTEAIFNSPEGVESLEFIVDLVNEYEIAINWSGDRGSFIPALQDGTVAMFMNGPYVMGQMRDGIPEQEGLWGVSEPFKQKELGTHIGGTYLSVFDQSEYKEEAWTFIEFLLREENQVALFETSGAAPAYLPAINNEIVNKPDPYFGDQVPIEIFGAVVDQGISNPVISQWQQISTIIDEAVETAIYQELSAKEALDHAAERVNNLLEE